MTKLATQALMVIGAAVGLTGGVVAQERHGHDRDHDSMDPAVVEAVYNAVLDYVEGVYYAQPDRIRRSVHPSLTKIGYARRDGGDQYSEFPMTFDELVELSAEWNADRRRDPESLTKEIRVLDVLDQTAVARLDADWGVDYVQLAKFDGRWKIVNVVWQTVHD